MLNLTQNTYDLKNKLMQFLQKNDVIHPGTAAVDYLRSIDFKGKIFLIGCSVFKKLLTDAGFEVIIEVNMKYLILFTN